MRRVGQGGFEGADGEMLGFVGAGFGWGDGAEGAEEVVVGFVGVAGFAGCVGDAEVERSLVLGIRVPFGDPGVEVLELGAEGFEQGGGTDDAQDGEEDVVADVV